MKELKFNFEIYSEEERYNTKKGLTENNAIFDVS